MPKRPETLEIKPDSLASMGAHLAEIATLLNQDRELAAHLGPSFFEHTRSLCAGFRQRFPQQWPGSQPPLF